MHPTREIMETYKSGDYENTIRLADARLRTTPDDVVAAQLRAYSLSFSTRTQEALEAYREAIEIVEGLIKKEPRVASLRGDLWFNLGCEFLKVGKKHPALSAITQSIRYDEKNLVRARSNALCNTSFAGNEEWTLLIGSGGGEEDSDDEEVLLDVGHQPSAEELGAPEDGEFVWGGFFVAWLIQRKHHSLALAEIAGRVNVEGVSSRRFTGPMVFKELDGCLDAAMVTAEARPFAEEYLGLDSSMAYLQDFCRTFKVKTSDMKGIYSVKDTWKNADRMMTVIDAAFARTKD